MSYQIVWDKKSRDFLKKIEKKDAQRIIRKVNDIVENPLRYLDTLVNMNCYRLRVGDYRVLIEINEEDMSLNVLLIGHRKNIYKSLKRFDLEK